MEDALERYEDFGATEAYELVRTVGVTMSGRFYRLEVRHTLGAAPGASYSITGYVLEHVRLERSDHSIPPPPDTGPIEADVWMRIDLPWVAMPNADVALAQGLGFLAVRAGLRPG